MNARRLLRYARRSSGLTQRQLAMRARLPQSTVARIEAGRLQPRWETIARLLTASGHSLEVSRAGEGIDRSQFRALLAMTPHQRLVMAARDAQGLAAFLDAGREAAGADRTPG